MNVDQKRIMEFFKPNWWKGGVALAVFYLAVDVFGNFLWGHHYSLFQVFLFWPFFEMELYALLFAIPYSYLLSCVIVWGFKKLKGNKLVISVVIVGLVLLFGFDEPIMNNTINRPDYSCSVDTDCKVKNIKKGWCGHQVCLNEDWEYYDSLANSVFALSCLPKPISCTCEQDRCVTNDLRDSTNPEDCENLEPRQKETCLDVVKYNLEQQSDEE